jgi:hypothetical protein
MTTWFTKVSDVPAGSIAAALANDGWTPLEPPGWPRPVRPLPHSDAESYNVVGQLALASPDGAVRLQIDTWDDRSEGAGFNAHLWALGEGTSGGAPGFGPDVAWCVDVYRSPPPATVIDAARAAASADPERPPLAAEVLRRAFWHADGKSNNTEIVNRRGAEIAVRYLRPRSRPFLWEIHLQDERLWTAMATRDTPVRVIAVLVRRRRSAPTVPPQAAPSDAATLTGQVRELRFRLAVVEKMAWPIACGSGDESLIGEAIREVASGRRTPQQAVANLGEGWEDTLDGLLPEGG